jgi:hypothetical protein
MRRGWKEPGSKLCPPWVGNIFLLNLFLAAGLMLGSCAQIKNGNPQNEAPAADQKLETRNNAASLLYDLLGNEKNVSTVLIVKHASPELGRLIKAISETATDNYKELEQLAKFDFSLNLKATGLPPGEVTARKSAAKADEHALLFSSGKEFEFHLLLTQAEALSYGQHLAKIAAENSSRPGEVQTFTAISQAMNGLYGQVIAQMRRNS